MFTDNVNKLAIKRLAHIDALTAGLTVAELCYAIRQKIVEERHEVPEDQLEEIVKLLKSHPRCIGSITFEESERNGIIPEDEWLRLEGTNAGMHWRVIKEEEL